MQQFVKTQKTRTAADFFDEQELTNLRGKVVEIVNAYDQEADKIKDPDYKAEDESKNPASKQRGRNKRPPHDLDYMINSMIRHFGPYS